MTETGRPEVQRLLWSTAELSLRLGIPASTLRTWRSNGEGPRFIRIKGRAKYRPHDVELWLDRQAKLTQGRGR